MEHEHSKGTALITGASTGIGAVYADRLARRGHDLILVARNRDRLNALADRLTSQTGRSVEVVVADLADPSDQRRVERILQTDASLAMLVNNAGVGSAAPLVASNVDSMESMIDLNVTALTRLIYAVAPKFVGRGAGAIINIASAVAIAPETLNGVYGATKAYVLALSQSLHHELASKGVRIQAVLPGAIRTSVLGRRRPPGRQPAARECDGRERPGRRGARRFRRGRADDHTVAAGPRAVGRLPGRARRVHPGNAVPGQACGALRGPVKTRASAK